MRDRRLRQVLDRDILLDFQQATGRSYKDPAVQWESLGYFLVENVRRDAAIRAAGDTLYVHDFADYCAKVRSLGFREVRRTTCWTAPVTSTGRRVAKPAVEWWHDTHGVLLSCAATKGETGWLVNAADIFFNWRPRDPKDGPRACSGQWCQDAAGAWVYLGGKDMRVGLLFEWADLVDAGTFVTPWVRCVPFLHLNRTGGLPAGDQDPGMHRWRRIRDYRLSRLPPEILARMQWTPAVDADRVTR